MGISKTRYEQRSLLESLETYLDSVGWSGEDILYTDGYQPETQIENPQIVVSYPPSTVKELQLGKVQGQDRLFNRRIQIDVYTDSEKRTSNIVDDIMDFLDETCIYIKDHNDALLGTLICDSETITGDNIPPFITVPKVLRWRGVVRAEAEAHYPGTP